MDLKKQKIFRSFSLIKPEIDSIGLNRKTTVGKEPWALKDACKYGIVGQGRRPRKSLKAAQRECEQNQYLSEPKERR